MVQAGREDFTYDALNRITGTTLTDTGTGGQLAQTTYQYDAIGNITFKSDVGTYSYNGIDGGPHAVTAAGANSYSYDANGNMVGGAGRTILWSSFDKPVSIAGANDSVAFVYGPDNRARVKQTATTGGLVTTIKYVGDSYEKHARAGAPDELVHYIRAAGTVAIYTRVDDTNPATDKTRYLHRDHLGSIVALTDEAGAVAERLAFDPHGQRREPDWQAALLPIQPWETPRGFTGHEHLDGVGLVHMNGRVYEPVLGRFLSADPFVGYPETTQGFNRYSYVNNNPLSFTDPSGFDRGVTDDRGYTGSYDGGFGPSNNPHGNRGGSIDREAANAYGELYREINRLLDQGLVITARFRLETFHLVDPYQTPNPIGLGFGLGTPAGDPLLGHGSGYAPQSGLSAGDPLSAGALFGAAGVISFANPLPGPEDLVALGVAAIGVGVVVAGVGVIQHPSELPDTRQPDEPYERIAFGQRRISPKFRDGLTLPASAVCNDNFRDWLATIAMAG
jgi:RHS repeat-associated protein